MTQFINNPEEAKEFLPRYRYFYVALTIAVVTFSARLWYLQIIQGSELREFSEKNRIKQVKIVAPRGHMVDREGRILVENNPGFEAILSPQYIDDTDEVAARVAPILGTTAEKVVEKVERSRKQNGPFAQVKLKENLSRDEVFRLKRIRLDTPGLEIRETVVRHYALGESGAQLFGYVGEISAKQLPVYNQIFKGLTFEQGDIIGKSGLEEVLEREIRGQDGYQFLQVDALGREALTQNASIYGEQIHDQEPIPGANAELTLDKDLQDAAWNSITKLNRQGAVFAMKTNGEVLAWVSAPSYDPNSILRTRAQWNKLINDPNKPLLNKVVQDHFAPGSTFKPFMAMTALEEKVITPQTVIYCPGSMRFGRREYHDSVRGGHGNVTVYEAIEQSANVFFFKMGIALGIDRMFKYISTFGFGSHSGVEVPREVSGLMPSAEWKQATFHQEWQPGENLSNAIGQGFVQVTPIQLAVAYNAIGLEGRVVRPFVVHRVKDVDGKVLKENQPQILRDLTQTQSTGIKMSQGNFKVVKDALKRVIQGHRGTARSVRIPGIEMAGKTGTAQVMGFSASDIYTKCENRPFHQRHHGWFIAFAPADQPEITVVALAEHSCHGNPGASPLVRDVMLAYFNKYHKDWIEEGAKAEKEHRDQAPAPLDLGEPPEGE
ncbi:MAG: penicillin-binding protein 2 [Bdellovibrio sp.]|nr:MAG: penicillin-binding protein 2 [Bdellovibrio sp.]